VQTYDTFATVCWLMRIPPTVPDMDGSPVRQIPEQGDGELLKPTPTKAKSAG
jgi:hypothetical protein